MNYPDFFRFLKKWRDFKRNPPASGWPSEIRLDSKAWEGVQKLYNLTKMDNHEYETSFFFVEGETLLTTPMRGTRDQVSAKHSLQVKYQVNQKKRMYDKQVIIDGKLVSSTPVKPEKLPNQTDVGFLFNIHTHPEHLNAAGQITYSFFSDTDMRTLISSSAMLTGVVTDKLWLACKTDRVISKVGEVGEELLREVSERAFAGDDYLDQVIRENMARWGLVFYKGRFREPLRRVS